MKFVFFYHSILSDWNNGNAHFLRGIVHELLRRNMKVSVYEPSDGWSRTNLLANHGKAAIHAFKQAYPGVHPVLYDPATLDLDEALEDADVVLVHEWNEPQLVERIGRHRSRGSGYRLFFHDTHHRSLSDPAAMAVYDLSAYDGVLAFGEVIREIYERRGWHRCSWTWHEAADTNLFRPLASGASESDLVWVGNWGDEERSAELREYLLEPVHSLRLRARIYGVRYPREALEEIRRCGAAYEGWLANLRVPEIFARSRMTVHIPRRPYATMLPGIPTIRVFEALACGIPLICSPWNDAEGLFRPGSDYLMAGNGEEMQRMMAQVLADRELSTSLAAHGLETIRSRHSCSHRVDELMEICRRTGLEKTGAAPAENREVI